MSDPLSKDLSLQLRIAFRMPSVQTMMSRKSSITNAFVNSLIPVLEPSAADISEALRILGLDHTKITCCYCGDKATEWDHLRALVIKRRPTGYISEIGNLVPACGKCNQSKGNKDWHVWIRSFAPQSPTKRKIADLEERVDRLKAFEGWRPSEPVNFEEILGSEVYAEYWAKMDQSIEFLRECQNYANDLKKKIIHSRRRKDV